ncbi:MAG: hypothetical protein PHW54_06495 [Candidatus Omnitrophica bacterium]|nr:hypothetical protein [Candidatus Omnitrophota bacterium]
MDDLIQLDVILKNVIIFASILGILAGIDLLFGAKVTSNLKKTLDEMTFNVDKIIIKASSVFRKKLDADIKIDEKIIKTKARIALGLLFIVVSVVMILLIQKF